MWKTCKRFAKAVTWKNLFRKIAGEIVAGRVGGIKSSLGLAAETPRPPICRIFSPVKLLKRYFNRLINIDFLAFYATKGRLEKAAFFIGISLWQ